jgi:hypothetical protein
MGYKIHTNKTTEPKQTIKFMKKLLQNPRNFNLKYSFKYTSKQPKKLSNDMDLPSRVNPKKMKSKPPPPPLFPIFYGHRTDNSHDSHCALSKEEEGGSMSSYLYIGTIVTSIVTLACSSLLIQ